MGNWAKSSFGREKIGNVGIVLAGTIKPKLEKEILGMFDEVLSSQDSVYHNHLVRKGKKTYPIVANIYGAPAMVDVLAELHDGGCRNVIFVGYAYGFKNREVGSVVLAKKSYHFDGIYYPLEPDKKADVPDKELRKILAELLKKKKVEYADGVNISVPAVTFQLPHANEEYKRINPTTVEMELASCLSRARDLGIRAAGILIISDNRKSSLGDASNKMKRSESKKKVLELIFKQLKSFDLPARKVKKQFTIDQHLASIIDDPTDVTNVYRNK